MAPEQLEGKDADARTDIFAFGAVLYEMATGRKAFSGTSQASLISAIMQNDPPPISTVQPMTPPALDRVARKCLAKDPEDRWQSAGDLGSELKWIAESGSQAGIAAPIVASRRRSLRFSGIAAAAFALIAAALAAALLTRRSAELPLIRASILPPEGSDFISKGINAGPVEISPNGRRLVFTARKGEGPNLLWVRDLTDSVARPLSGTEGAERPFWSPDGKYIGFFADRALKKIDVNGGPVFTLAEATEARGGTWNREGVILYSPDATWPRLSDPGRGRKAGRGDRVRPQRLDSSLPALPAGRAALSLPRAPQRRGRRRGSRDPDRRARLEGVEAVVNVASNAVCASGLPALRPRGSARRAALRRRTSRRRGRARRRRSGPPDG